MASRDSLRRLALHVVSPYPTWSRFRENMCSAQRAESEGTRSIARGALRSMSSYRFRRIATARRSAAITKQSCFLGRWRSS
jgi:hypothetical protein